MQNLQTAIHHLSAGRRLHISILDFSGLLDTPATKLPFCHIIHATDFCEAAKAVPGGYDVCIACKRRANGKIVREGRPFAGYCAWGLFEAAHPVIINDTVSAVVYVGHAVIDPQESKTHLYRTCARLKTDPTPFCRRLEDCERLDSPKELSDLAEIVADYLVLLYERTPKSTFDSHWLVHNMKRHAKERYDHRLSLKYLSCIYHKNEKYMGRLFKNEVGVSFGEYCMQIRLQQAEALLRESNKKILEIALDCGFNSVSYFNRAFLKKHGVSPTIYRKTEQKRD